MVDAVSLFTRGLKWSYRKYGLKGTVAFVLLVAVGYHFAERKLDELLDEESSRG